MNVPKVRHLQIGEHKVELIGYNAQLRKDGFHSYQAVLWSGTRGDRWLIKGRSYVVGKQPGGPWLGTDLNTKHQIYLGRTLKEAWTMLRLIYSS